MFIFVVELNNVYGQGKYKGKKIDEKSEINKDFPRKLKMGKQSFLVRIKDEPHT